VMTNRMPAIAMANTNPAGFAFGFGAMFPSWLRYFDSTPPSGEM
jgi:hypothetical protein